MKKIIYYVIYALLSALVLAAESYFVYRVFKLNMLPDLYVVLLIAVLLLILAGIGLLLFLPRKRLWVSVLRQVVAILLSAATVLGCNFLVPKIHELEDTVEQITANEPTKTVRSVYVALDDPAQTLADAADYRFGAMAYDCYCIDQLVAAMGEELQTEISVTYFETEAEMMASYYVQELDALLLNEGIVRVWRENETYPDFQETHRVLYTSQVREGTAEYQPSAIESENQEKVSDLTNTPFVVYLSGMDGYTKNLVASRSDTNILLVVNPETKQILMINTPRDYYIVHPWGNGTRDKLTHCGVYGIDCSVRALEMLYELDVSYYIQINFTGFEELIDALGGVTVYSENSFYGGDDADVYIAKGEIVLNGEEALAFARDRKHQPGGDNGRGKNQMKVIKAVINKMSNADVMLSNYSEILNSLEGMIATNFATEDIQMLVKMQLTDFAKWNVQTYAVVGYDSSNTTYSMPGTNAYVMIPNQKSVDYAKELVARVVAGETLTAEDMTMPS